MATSSTIALEYADGSVKQVYCHWDGYLDHVGDILQKHWSDPARLAQLLEMGSISILGNHIGVKREFENPYPYGSADWTRFRDQYRDQCLFFTRDRGEEFRANRFSNIKDYFKHGQRENYNYILKKTSSENHVWYVAYFTSEFKTLESAFKEESNE